MTQYMDNFFIHLGLNGDELTGVETRSMLYAGILFMVGITLILASQMALGL